MNINHIQVGATNILKSYLGNVVIYQKAMGLISLFAGGKQGFWYEPTDITTLYQDSAGTVTTKLVGDPIGLVLDKSQGLARGSELVANANTVATWTVVFNSTISQGVNSLVVSSISSGAYRGVHFPLNLEDGKSYKLKVNISSTGGRGNIGIIDANYVSLAASALYSGNDNLAEVIYHHKSSNGAVSLILRVADINMPVNFKDASIQNIKGNHAVQTVSTKRSIYNVNPSRITLDKVDDEFVITVPTGGWIGTMVVATDIGTASYEVNLAAGKYLLGKPASKFDRNIVGVVLRNGALTEDEKTSTKDYFVGKGAVADYGAVTSFIDFWRDRTEITSFPIINTSKVTNFTYAWYQCLNLTDFPLLNTSSGVNFASTWYSCTKLANIPANMFDSIKGGNFTNAFVSTALTQVSIDNILTSLVTSGIATGTRVFNQSGGAAPSIIGTAAIDTLRLRGWTVTVTGGY